MSPGRRDTPCLRHAPLGWAGASLALLSACATPGPAPASAPAPAYASAYASASPTAASAAAAASSARPAATAGQGTVPATCNAQAVQDLLGQPGSPQLAEAARVRAQAQRVRLIAHDEMVTKEYDAGRLNLQMDAARRVVRIYCG